MAETLDALLEAVRNLPVPNQRVIAAIIGATVADAAARPLHWIYDQTKLNSILKNAKVPEFWTKSECPFYTIPLGQRSTYNDIMLVSLKSLNEKNGKVDIKHLCESIKHHFGEGTAYAEAFKRRREAYDPMKKGSFCGPIEGPWIHMAITDFLRNYAEGKAPYGNPENKDNDAFCLIVPIIAMMSMHSDFEHVWNVVAPIASLFTTNAYATKIYQSMTVLLNGFISDISDPLLSMREHVKVINPELHDLMNTFDDSTTEQYISTVAKHGKACSLPGSFLGAYLAMTQTESYVDAVRLNITAGGCNCSRSNIIGSCFGAKYGIDAIPLEWMKKVNDIELIIEMAIKVTTNIHD